MASFSIILEDVTRTIDPKNPWRYDNQRIVSIDATDINDAWNQARHQYYTLKIDGPTTQIVDIEAGTITSMEELNELKASRSVQISGA